MSVPDTVANFLRASEIPFSMVTHRPTKSSMETAEAARISGDRMAKAVMLEDGDRYVMAVIPASHRIDTEALSEITGGNLHMVGEDDFSMIFRDCRAGAVPPLGAAYGIRTVVDDAIAVQPDVYLESGDHEHLIHVDHLAFERLMRSAQHGRFSYHL
jgi:Ala-tRNA(Pro) deacylase